MHEINIDNWKRKKHYELFSSFSNPYFSMTTNLDITKFLQNIKKNNSRFFNAFLHILLSSVNSLNDFKIRIRKDKIIEHKTLNCSFTVLNQDKDLFSFAYVDFNKDFDCFNNNLNIEIKKARKNISLGNSIQNDNLIYFSSIPWISFTQANHPYNGTEDLIPRFAIGKYFSQDSKILLPFSIQCHHGLLDGIHIGKLTMLLQKKLDQS